MPSADKLKLASEALSNVAFAARGTEKRYIPKSDKEFVIVFSREIENGLNVRAAMDIGQGLEVELNQAGDHTNAFNVDGVQGASIDISTNPPVIYTLATVIGADSKDPEVQAALEAGGITKGRGR